jgi:hypothetical protein
VDLSCGVQGLDGVGLRGALDGVFLEGEGGGVWSTGEVLLV